MKVYHTRFGWPEKLVFGLLTTLLCIVAFFTSLLILAAGGALLTMAAIKFRWRQHQQRTNFIEAEYQVLSEK